MNPHPVSQANNRNKREQQTQQQWMQQVAGNPRWERITNKTPQIIIADLLLLFLSYMIYFISLLSSHPLWAPSPRASRGSAIHVFLVIIIKPAFIRLFKNEAGGHVNSLVTECDIHIRSWHCQLTLLWRGRESEGQQGSLKIDDTNVGNTFHPPVVWTYF